MLKFLHFLELVFDIAHRLKLLWAQILSKWRWLINPERHRNIRGLLWIDSSPPFLLLLSLQLHFQLINLLFGLQILRIRFQNRIIKIRLRLINKLLLKLIIYKSICLWFLFPVAMLRYVWLSWDTTPDILIIVFTTWLLHLDGLNHLTLS